MKDPLTIAIDYDDTFTADPTAWAQVIQLLQSFGHRVICVSARRDTLEHRQELTCELPDGVAVFLSYGTPKREYVKSYNMQVDIWIDDTPESIPTKQDMIAMCG